MIYEQIPKVRPDLTWKDKGTDHTIEIFNELKSEKPYFITPSIFLSLTVNLSRKCIVIIMDYTDHITEKYKYGELGY